MTKVAKQNPAKVLEAELEKASKAATKDEAAAPVEVKAEDVTSAAMIALLTQQLAEANRRLNELEAQYQAKRQQEESNEPPPTPRKQRSQIYVYVTPDTMVRREVPQWYIEKKLPGWDGTPVKGYLNHDNSRIMRS